MVFSSQATVKEIMYQGLMKLVVLDPVIAGPVFDLLWPQFLDFYSEVFKSISLLLLTYMCLNYFYFQHNLMLTFKGQ